MNFLFCQTVGEEPMVYISSMNKMWALALGRIKNTQKQIFNGDKVAYVPQAVEYKCPSILKEEG